MNNNIVKEDMLCHATGKHCDDECCTVGSVCNISDVISDSNNSSLEIDYNRDYEEFNKYDVEIREHNKSIFSSKCEEFIEDYKILTSDIHVTNKIEIVPEPEGTNQEDFEEYKSFSSIYIQEWSRGWSEDNYEGFIFAKMIDGKWLKIPYSC